MQREIPSRHAPSAVARDVGADVSRPAAAPDVTARMLDLDQRRLDHESRLIALAETLTSGLIAARDEARAGRSEAEERLAGIADAFARTLETARTFESLVGSLRAEIAVGDALNAEYLAENEELKARIAHLEQCTAAISHQNAGTPTAPDPVVAVPSSLMPSPHVLSAIYSELARHRETRAQRLLAAVRRDVLWDDVGPGFVALKGYAGSNLRSRGYRLGLSEDLRTLDYREYAMALPHDGPSRIAAAVNPLVPSGGWVGVEVVSADRVVLAQSVVPLAGVSNEAPVIFELAPGRLARGWRLRIFVRDATAPVTIYELVNPSVLRRRPRRRPFVSIE